MENEPDLQAALESFFLGETPSVAPAAAIRQQVLDLALAPRQAVDPALYSWHEIAPGLKVHVLQEDETRGMRASLVWARPGATYGRHRHHGLENVLVLEGALQDEHGLYGPGAICRGRAGSVHTEVAVGEVDCFCFVVTYGPLERIG